ncbi:MAG: peptide chain release factor N(5)-glutamine methyltransferase [Pseudomonadota bacterium]
MTSAAQAIRDAAQTLAETSDTARLDAEILMAHAMGVSRSDLLIRGMDAEAPARFHRLVERRGKREPVAYITGAQEFYGHPFIVTRDTLIPRPDSEVVVEAALDILGDAPENSGADSILDLGTGTGALLLSVLAQKPTFRGRGIDQSAAAIAVAERNAAALGLSDRANFSVNAWHGETDAQGQPWWSQWGRFELVIANPPYVESGAALDPDVSEYEPASALYAGEDGLDDYRLIIPGLAHITSKAVLEIGATQADSVAQLAEKAGFATELRYDLANRPRALILS